MPIPSDDDLRHDDHEYNPQLEPRKANAWLNLLRESETTFEKWHEHCDLIDKQYANLDRLSGMSRDKEFQMFWANVEVIGPSIYANPPAPAVTPKWNDRRPVPQAASEVLERCVTITFDLAHINELMLQIRNDVVLIGRGVAWCRYEPAGDHYDYECVCIDFKHRRDFLHSISRSWAEVTWVAAAAYLTRTEARERFAPFSGSCYQDAEYKVDRDAKEVGGMDSRERAKFWEIWDKTNKRVVWVAEGCEDILDEDDPHLDCQDFFPCPRPAYGTLQRGSLVPVPDVLQYKDQLDEINLLTAKIHALSNVLEAKGFYPGGGTELADAINTAMSINTPGRVLIPIGNWAAFGGTKEVIVWMPIAEIAQTITQCLALRKEIVQDIYQITGLADIMRGSTDPQETLGAQQIKTQYGSSRIRDKQQEMVRIARDLVNIAAEIITEKFSEKTIIAMSQTELPSKAQVEQQARAMAQQIGQQQMQLAQAQQQMSQPPQPGTPPPPSDDQDPRKQMGPMLGQAQAMIDQGKRTLESLRTQPTFDQVMKLFRDSRIKAFTLDIETDSTIQVDENTEKQRRAEFTAVLAQLLPQLTQMITAEPQTAAFCGEVMKFTVAPYRAGRSLDRSIDDLAAIMQSKAQQPRGDDPTTIQARTAKEIEQLKIAHMKEKDQLDAKLKTQEMQMRDAHEKAKIASNEKLKLADLRGKTQDDQAKTQHTELKAMADREKHQADMMKSQSDLQAAAQKIDLAKQAAQIKQSDMAARANERQAMQQFKMSQPQRPPGGAL